MDVITLVTTDPSWKKDIPDIPEATRRAFVELFRSESTDAKLVADWLVGKCGWRRDAEPSKATNGIDEAKQNATCGIIRDIIIQLNRPPIENHNPREGE
jgi:hypothetical protein